MFLINHKVLRIKENIAVYQVEKAYINSIMSYVHEMVKHTLKILKQMQQDF